jgi:uncharacterized membrane-anchored protein
MNFKFDWQTILMYVLIVVGIVLLTVPTDVLDKYSPEFIKKVDMTTRMIIGLVCFGGAYYIYDKSNVKSVKLDVSASDFSSEPPNYKTL